MDDDRREGWKDRPVDCEAERETPSSRGCRCREPIWNGLGACFDMRVKVEEAGKGDDDFGVGTLDSRGRFLYLIR